MHYPSSGVEARVRRFRAEYLRPALHRRSAPLRLTAWEVPDEPVPFAEAVGRSFTPFAAGSAWGRPWGTVWFHATGSVLSGWRGEAGTSAELVVDLGFNDALPGFQAEATVYTPSGRIVKAIEPMNRSVALEGLVGDDGLVDLYIEAAANPRVKLRDLFTPTPYGDKATAGTDRLYRLGRADVALLDQEVWELEQDCAALVGLLEQLPESSQRRAGILQALDQAVDAMDPDDISGTAPAGRAVLAPALSRPASASAHRLHAVGHAHIDSAWLWPTRETVRKVARTFSNVCDLIDSHPGFVFAASSAQQYAWLKEYYPDLFERVREKVRSGNFVPVGGMWVESDTNLPGGEALVRQFLAGKTFFLREFGVDTEEVWLPDSFGYSAALPQIVAAAGARWFLTQKISWNETNVMPHHTFFWEGIDGTQVFTHFPPVDTYNSDLGAADLARAESQYAEKGIGTTSLVPFGYGDGGGGPTREMLAAAARTRSLEGSPTVTLSSPRAFFEDAESEYPQPPVWSGELYLEFHRGSYTSQARTKRGNRRSEHLLREAELWATTAAVRVGAPYPAAALERIWHTVLLQQFHDILPGTSIAWVHQEAERNYAEVEARLESIIGAAVTALLGEGENSVALNAGPYAVGGVPALGGGRAVAHGTTPNGRAERRIERVDGGYVCDNGLVRLRVDDAGLIRSMVDLRADRELLPAGRTANLLQLHRDTPTQWDAWDIDDHYRRTTEDLDAAAGVGIERRGDRDVLVVHREFGASSVTQTLSLEPGSPTVEIRTEIDWHERKKLLKLAFPFDIHADRATSEIQFGHVHRPTHANTSWDAARFETVAHRWVHVGEADYGVAVANDATYGHDITRSRNGSRDSATTVRLSLLRAPVFPDPGADQGRHTMNVSLRVGAAVADAVREGYRLNLPVRTVEGVGDTEIRPLFTVSNDAVVVEAVKPAEDGGGDVVVRLYEAHGTRARAAVRADFPTASVTETDLMERDVPAGAVTAVDGNTAHLELRPFQLLTLRFSPEARGPAAGRDRDG
ncbi:alpha-mannosidase [Kocuria sp. M1R5S2]|uniref:alpha-mannosidase n=1 Tax=Kocuria rhizosphaerae TaxID=3376285 RepID=UPI0037A388BC